MYVSWIAMLLVQPKDGRYAKNAGAVFNLSYYVVWRPKYRRKVLVGDVEQRLKHILYARAQQYGVLIETMEVMPDHVHLFVSSDPTRCVAEIVTLKEPAVEYSGVSFLT